MKDHSVWSSCHKMICMLYFPYFTKTERFIIMFMCHVSIHLAWRFMFLVCPQNKLTKFKILIQGCVQSVRTNSTIITRNEKWQEIKTRKGTSKKSRILAKERKRPKKLQMKVMIKNSKLILMRRHMIMTVTVKMKTRFGEKERLFQKRSPEMKNFKNILRNYFYN